jgi:membrane fusion protein, heavy metal efflux system
MEYQLKQLNSERAARLQELRLRGLNAHQIDRIVDERELVSEIEVRLSIAAGGENGDASWQVTLVTDFETAQGPDSSSDIGPIYTVEQLNVFPGRAVQKGEELCHIASHYELFVRGEAFESDVPAIRRLNERGWGVDAEFGEEAGAFQSAGLERYLHRQSCRLGDANLSVLSFLTQPSRGRAS